MWALHNSGGRKISIFINQLRRFPWTRVEVDSSEKHCPWDTNFTDARCLDKDQKAWDEQIYATEDDCILMKNYSFQTYLKLSLFFVLFFT
ncbi:uncharacterized protein LOC111394475 isoform X3 [Olea europaea var. sylvestris]|uniref:uncharacterized protein LOC111394475 isoform X3 n=1 Tax=Olea europaea var. sylvestris TaxID=158386 RepID=UPI000C1D3656|nr:uncharacterized protein LOC111394475 isoform X3 [Olea europaea var. sylvestris]